MQICSLDIMSAKMVRFSFMLKGQKTRVSFLLFTMESGLEVTSSHIMKIERSHSFMCLARLIRKCQWIEKQT